MARGIPTPRDKLERIVELVAAGKSPEQVAAELDVAINVVRRAKQGIFPKATWGHDDDMSEVEVKVTLGLPLSLAAEIQAEAKRRGRTFASEVIQRLRRVPAANSHTETPHGRTEAADHAQTTSLEESASRPGPGKGR